jgi:hypothetical protein
MKLTAEQYEALACAVAVLEGTAGGYTKEQKDQAKETLLTMVSGAQIEE